MKFINTKRFSPVIFFDDVPWPYDLFHHDPASVPVSKKEYYEFLTDNNIVIDKNWWEEQERRCLHGYDIPDAIEHGGDAYEDEKDVFWNDDPKKERYLKRYNYTIPPNSCYIPQYDLLIKDRVLHLTGRHYFYLNFWKIFRKIEGVNRKDVLPPRFTDLDFFYFRRVELMYELGLDMSELKGRQLGFSSKAGGGLLGFNYTFYRNSVNVVVGGTSEDSNHTMEEAQRGLDELINTQFYKERSKNRSDFWKAKHFGSELRSISAKDNPQALSRFSPTLVIYEEIGKMSAGLIKELKEFVWPSIKAEGQRTGYQIYIATGGDMDLGAQDMQDIHYDPEANDVLSFENIWDRDKGVTMRSGHFTPAWLFKILDENGNSNKEEGFRFVLEERKRKKAKDRYTHTTQHALYASDAFMIKSGGFFGEDVVRRCNQQLSLIRTHKELQVIERGWLRWKNRSNKFEGVYFEPDPNGPFMIYEHPQLDGNDKPYLNLYKVATDSYDQDESYTTTSQGSCWVKKTFLNAESVYDTYVAGLEQRPSTSEGGREVFYEGTALLTMYYGAKNLIEWSKILIFDWYVRNGLEGLLKERPEFVLSRMIQRSNTTNFYGIDPSTKLHWLKIQSDYLNKEGIIEKCMFPLLLERWSKFKFMPGKIKYNCDTTIATSLCSVMEEDERLFEVMDSSAAETRQSLMKFKKVNGVLKQVW